MGRRLLIIDDDPAVCDALKDRLEAMGYTVIVAHDGRTGLALMTLEANRAPIGGVLLDLQLPVMDGIQVLREIRLRSHHVPVVMMTANHDHTVREEALRLGVSHVFLKPFDTPRFVQMCEQIFPLTDGDT